nr:MAG TPA: hypothetical protein [Caudoviricetes sp.]
MDSELFMNGGHRQPSSNGRCSLKQWRSGELLPG